MPIRYRIDPAKRRVYNTATAVVRGSEFLDVQRAMITDPAFDPNFSQLFDLTAIEAADISSDEIHAMADRTAFGRGARRAIVVNQTLVLGLTRMYQIWVGARGGDIEIFNDVESAERWLDGGYDSPAPVDDAASAPDRS